MVTNFIEERITPSVISYTSKGILYGEEARAKIHLNSKNTITNVKRLLGAKWSPENLDLFTATPECSMTDGFDFKVNGGDYSAE